MALRAAIAGILSGRLAIKDGMDIEEKLIALESKFAHQEYLLDVLNQTVVRQQKQLDELDTLSRALAKRLADVQLRVPEGMLPHEKPPHY